ncbi:unnamed protein product, partial [Amoebophrya sp. A120]
SGGGRGSRSGTTFGSPGSMGPARRGPRSCARNSGQHYHDPCSRPGYAGTRRRSSPNDSPEVEVPPHMGTSADARVRAPYNFAPLSSAPSPCSSSPMGVNAMHPTIDEARAAHLELIGAQAAYAAAAQGESDDQAVSAGTAAMLQAVNAVANNGAPDCSSCFYGNNFNGSTTTSPTGFYPITPQHHQSGTTAHHGNYMKGGGGNKKGNKMQYHEDDVHVGALFLDNASNFDINQQNINHQENFYDRGRSNGKNTSANTKDHALMDPNTGRLYRPSSNKIPGSRRGRSGGGMIPVYCNRGAAGRVSSPTTGQQRHGKGSSPRSTLQGFLQPHGNSTKFLGVEHHQHGKMMKGINGKRDNKKGGGFDGGDSRLQKNGRGGNNDVQDFRGSGSSHQHVDQPRRPLVLQRKRNYTHNPLAEEISLFHHGMMLEEQQDKFVMGLDQQQQNNFPNGDKSVWHDESVEKNRSSRLPSSGVDQALFEEIAPASTSACPLDVQCLMDSIDVLEQRGYSSRGKMTMTDPQNGNGSTSSNDAAEVQKNSTDPDRQQGRSDFQTAPFCSIEGPPESGADVARKMCTRSHSSHLQDKSFVRTSSSAVLRSYQHEAACSRTNGGKDQSAVFFVKKLIEAFEQMVPERLLRPTMQKEALARLKKYVLVAANSSSGGQKQQQINCNQAGGDRDVGATTSTGISREEGLLLLGGTTPAVADVENDNKNQNYDNYGTTVQHQLPPVLAPDVGANGAREGVEQEPPPSVLGCRIRDNGNGVVDETSSEEGGSRTKFRNLHARPLQMSNSGEIIGDHCEQQTALSCDEKTFLREDDELDVDDDHDFFLAPTAAPPAASTAATISALLLPGATDSAASLQLVDEGTTTSTTIKNVLNNQKDDSDKIEKTTSHLMPTTSTLPVADLQKLLAFCERIEQAQNQIKNTASSVDHAGTIDEDFRKQSKLHYDPKNAVEVGDEIIDEAAAAAAVLRKDVGMKTLLQQDEERSSTHLMASVKELVRVALQGHAAAQTDTGSIPGFPGFAFGKAFSMSNNNPPAARTDHVARNYGTSSTSVLGEQNIIPYGNNIKTSAHLLGEKKSRNECSVSTHSSAEDFVYSRLRALVRGESMLAFSSRTVSAASGTSTAEPYRISSSCTENHHKNTVAPPLTTADSYSVDKLFNKSALQELGLLSSGSWSCDSTLSAGQDRVSKHLDMQVDEGAGEKLDEQLSPAPGVDNKKSFIGAKKMQKATTFIPRDSYELKTKSLSVGSQGQEVYYGNVDHWLPENLMTAAQNSVDTSIAAAAQPDALLTASRKTTMSMGLEHEQQTSSAPTGKKHEEPQPIQVRQDGRSNKVGPSIDDPQTRAGADNATDIVAPARTLSSKKSVGATSSGNYSEDGLLDADLYPAARRRGKDNSRKKHKNRKNRNDKNSPSNRIIFVKKQVQEGLLDQGTHAGEVSAPCTAVAGPTSSSIVDGAALPLVAKGQGPQSQPGVATAAIDSWKSKKSSAVFEKRNNNTGDDQERENQSCKEQQLQETSSTSDISATRRTIRNQKERQYKKNRSKLWEEKQALIQEQMDIDHHISMYHHHHVSRVMPAEFAAASQSSSYRTA